MAKSPAEMEAAMVLGLAEKTGKGLAEWLEVVQGCGLTKHGAIVAHLKEAHGLTHGYANLIVHKALGSSASAATDEGALVAAQYAGAKAGLRPLYDALMARIQEFGPDVEAAPKKGYVSLRRTKQFAILQPSTASRLDVGIQLKGEPASGRLEASGSFNGMVSHRVRVGSAAELDEALLGWLRRAYELA